MTYEDKEILKGFCNMMKLIVLPQLVVVALIVLEGTV
jgi:hypothetical protein|tara:strand:+ start:247 stop:357 length:111 start_codon:yes stop_codon:yes gene_type:complete